MNAIKIQDGHSFPGGERMHDENALGKAMFSKSHTDVSGPR